MISQQKITWKFHGKVNLQKPYLRSGTWVKVQKSSIASFNVELWHAMIHPCIVSTIGSQFHRSNLHQLIVQVMSLMEPYKTTNHEFLKFFIFYLLLLLITYYYVSILKNNLLIYIKKLMLKACRKIGHMALVYIGVVLYIYIVVHGVYS